MTFPVFCALLAALASSLPKEGLAIARCLYVLTGKQDQVTCPEDLKAKSALPQERGGAGQEYDFGAARGDRQESGGETMEQGRLKTYAGIFVLFVRKRQTHLFSESWVGAVGRNRFFHLVSRFCRVGVCSVSEFIRIHQTHDARPDPSSPGRGGPQTASPIDRNPQRPPLLL